MHFSNSPSLRRLLRVQSPQLFKVAEDDIRNCPFKDSKHFKNVIVKTCLDTLMHKTFICHFSHFKQNWVNQPPKFGENRFVCLDKCSKNYC